MWRMHTSPFLALIVAALTVACAPGGGPSPTVAPTSPAKAAPTAAPAAQAPEKPAQPKAAEPAPTKPAAKDLGTVRVALPHKVLFEIAAPFYVAEAKGFFKEEGLKVEPTFTAGGAANLQGVLTGEIDIVVATGTPSVYQAFSKGGPLRIISSSINGSPDIFWYVLNESPIKGFKDLNGKKVAFSNRGASSHMVVLTMDDMLKQQGGSGLEAVATGGPPDTFTAVRTRQIDAGWSVPPFFMEEVEKGVTRIVVRGAEVTPLKDITIRVNAANSNFAEKNPEAVAAYLRALDRAHDFMYSNKTEAVAIWKQRAELTLPDSILLKTWDYYPREALRLGPIKGIEENNKLAVQFGQLDKPLTKEQLDTLITPRFLPKR